MQTLPTGVRLESGRGGLRCLAIATDQAEAEIYLLGAHVTHFQPRGQRPVLFLSAQSWFEDGKPIRGGVPVCFPWFGPRRDGRPGANHGFARLRAWELMGALPLADGAVQIHLRLRADERTRQEWEGAFVVDYRVRVGAALTMELSVRNTGGQPFQFEEALHTYLAVGDSRQVQIEGLAGTTYLNTVGPTPREETQGTAPIRITAETDRIYQNTGATCVVQDLLWRRRLVIEKAGSVSTVVWNPWIAKSKAMPDFGDEEWPNMLCIETCNVRQNAVTLAPREAHVMTAVVRVE